MRFSGCCAWIWARASAPSGILKSPMPAGRPTLRSRPILQPRLQMQVRWTASSMSLHREFAFSDPSLQLARIRGYAGQMSGRADEAVEAYEHVVRAFPNDWESQNNLGNARLLAGDVSGAIVDLEKAVALAPGSAPSRINLARSYRLGGEFGKAENVLRKMAQDFPDDPQPLMDLHDLLKDLGRTRRYPAGARQRAEASAGRRRIASRTGEALRDDAPNGQGRSGFPRCPRARWRQWRCLCRPCRPSTSIARPVALAGLVEEAERHQIEPNALNLVRAFAYRRAKRFEEGSAALAQVDPDFEAPRREHLLGQMLEGLKDYDGAFAAFQRMNELQATDPSAPIERAALLARTGARAAGQDDRPPGLRAGRPPSVDAVRSPPLFLVGFPRSGTTLLDTIMMGHPDTVVMEERPVVSRLEQELGGFDAIAGLDEQAIRDAQKRYFEIAGEYVDVDAAPAARRQGAPASQPGRLHPPPLSVRARSSLRFGTRPTCC